MNTSKPTDIREFHIQRCGMKNDCEKLSRDFSSISACLNEKESENFKLRKQVKDYEQALTDWIDFENESIKKDGPYVGDKINKIISQAREVLKKWGGM